MRRLVAGLVLSAVFAASARGQAVLGTYTTTTAGQAGAVSVTFVLQKDAQGKLTGSLSRNGASYAVQGEMQGADAAGFLSGAGLRSYFAAHREGNQLRVIMADIGRDGKPDYSKARNVMFTARDAAGKASPSPPAAAAPATGGATSGATSGSNTAQDQQLSKLLTSSAWCSFSYSGSITGSTSSGTTQSSRVVFRLDGLLTETRNGETVNSGSAGSASGSSSRGQQLRWKVDNGQLMLNTNGAQWVPQQLKIAKNSSGYPIITSDGKEYMMCK